MKHIKAIIRPEKLAEVRDCISQVAGYKGIMITDIVGNGKQKGITQVWRGEKFQMDLIPKVMVELVVKDEDVGPIKKAIVKCAQTGEIGDGKIFVYPVEEVTRIRTGEEGEDAL